MDSRLGSTPGKSADRSVLSIQPFSGRRAQADFVAPGHPPARLWVELPGDLITPDEGEIGDAFFLAALPAAMKVGLPFDIRGRVSPSLVAGAAEWQASMVSLFPEKFRAVPVNPNGEGSGPVASGVPPEPASTDRGCLICFSGGVDSTFTARVFSGAANPLGLPLAAGLFVHGFDIEKNNHAGFAAAVERVRPILEAAGAKLLVARTNIRDLCHKFGLDWGQEVHGIHLAALLHIFRGGHSAGVIPSTYQIRDLKARWGSHPALDPSLGLPGFPIVHHGAPWNKLGKVRGIADWDVAAARLRVCWQGPDAAANCGVCFKCIATQLCFLAARGEIPAAFPRQFQPGEIRALRLRDRQNLRVAETILAALPGRGAGTWWLAEFEECINEGRARLAPEPPGPEALAAIGRAWLEQFSACVRARDFSAGERICLPGIHGFGTIAEAAAGIDDLRARQWGLVWPRTTGFHFCPDSIRCLAAADGTSIILTALWESTSRRAERMEFGRAGRATILLSRQPDGHYLAAHTHFSLTPNLENGTSSF
jgi:ketosteroid isomerase-like protein